MAKGFEGKKMDHAALRPIVEGVASKYARGTSVEKEDFAQDLWMWILQKDPATVSQARTILINKAIDMSRTSWREDRYQSGIGYGTDEETENYLCHNASGMISFTEPEDGVENVTIANILNSLEERERKYLVAKVYLTSGLDCLKNEFNKMVSELTEEDRIRYNDPKVQTNDDLIFQIFVGVRYGRNSGTARKIRERVRSVVSALA